ncbi:MAG: DUF4298 domain-containing protein [Neisseria sp.]|nr:DUF4298 domain-containing protein [Neisseria sp.]
MAMTKKDFDKLKQMQSLCAEVESDNKQLKQLLRLFKTADKRRDELQTLYENDWLHLVESEELSKEQRRELESLQAKGKYSILDQDTIWNALSDQYDLRVQLIKAAVKTL